MAPLARCFMAQSSPPSRGVLLGREGIAGYLPPIGGLGSSEVTHVLAKGCTPMPSHRQASSGGIVASKAVNAAAAAFAAVGSAHPAATSTLQRFPSSARRGARHSLSSRLHHPLGGIVNGGSVGNVIDTGAAIAQGGSLLRGGRGAVLHQHSITGGAFVAARGFPLQRCSSAATSCSTRSLLAARVSSKESVARRPTTHSPSPRETLAPPTAPATPEARCCSIDSETVVPQGLFVELMRRGLEVRRSGQHVLSKRRTDGCSKLVHKDLCPTPV